VSDETQRYAPAVEMDHRQHPNHCRLICLGGVLPNKRDSSS
jgi:hypothetical protein